MPDAGKPEVGRALARDLKPVIQQSTDDQAINPGLLSALNVKAKRTPQSKIDMGA